MKGRSILVTGASRGIGAELAAQLVARGARVIGVARRPFEAEGSVPSRSTSERRGRARPRRSGSAGSSRLFRADRQCRGDGACRSDARHP
ncbi:SDR family NAD(P)-dependent oxidoreductase [Seohaeicola zhoushanensis]